MLTIADPDGIKLEAKQFFATSPEARFARRLDAILLVCDGHPVPYVSKIFGLNPTTIQRWIHRLNEEGLAGLKDKPGRGRPSRLTTELREQVRLEVADSPEVFGYSQPRWDGKLLSQRLKDHYGVSLKVRQCQNILRDLNSC
ncbi:MAG: helix-turn-helix domain-containing protein [Desulfovibrionaceae bacterium]